MSFNKNVWRQTTRFFYLHITKKFKLVEGQVYHYTCVRTYTSIRIIHCRKIMIKLFPVRESLVSDIPAGDGKIAIHFIQCSESYKACILPLIPWAITNQQFKGAQAWEFRLRGCNTTKAYLVWTINGQEEKNDFLKLWRLLLMCLRQKSYKAHAQLWAQCF